MTDNVIDDPKDTLDAEVLNLASRLFDQVAAQGSTAGDGVVAAGDDAGRAQQVVRDHRAGQPGAVRGKQPRRDVCQRAVDQIGEGGLDDGVAAVGDVGLGGGQGRVGEERVMPHTGNNASG